MNSAIAVRDDPLEESVSERSDFSVLALDLLLRVDAAHPGTVDLTGKRDLATADSELKQVWFYLKHQGIVVGELTKCTLTPSGRKSVHSVLNPKHQSGSTAEQFHMAPAGTSATTLLLGVMRHHFAQRANTR